MEFAFAWLEFHSGLLYCFHDIPDVLFVFCEIVRVYQYVV